MTLGFWHDKQQHWKDGLSAAFELLKMDYTILDNEVGDVNIVWTSSINPLLERVPKDSIWLYAGGPIQDRGFITVVEDKWTQREFRKIGIETHLIFGVNTNIFRPLKLPIKYDVIFPAAFAKWKRHSLLVEWARGKKVLTVGHKQDVETECYEVCEAAGFEVKDIVSPEELAVLYNQSEACWIPSEVMGGSQRTLMEARACHLKIRVAEDNPRLQELLTEPIRSHFYYAEKLKDLCTSITTI